MLEGDDLSHDAAKIQTSTGTAVNSTNSMNSNNNSKEVHYECDYLVIGAGTTGMSFIDTILTESNTATVILVDRNDRPGGHWTTAYPYVKLHQASGNYGVNSEPLGKSFNKKGHEKIDPDDRATGEEIVEYYGKVLDKFKTCDRFKKAFFCAEYQKKEEEEEEPPVASSTNSEVHSIVDSNGDQIFIRCKKIVRVNTNVLVPSMRDAPFPVHEDVNFVDVNKVPAAVASQKYTNYVVIGAGKTGSDAVIELLKLGIDQSQIKWIISQDVWYVIREGISSADNHYKMTQKFLDPIFNTNNGKDLFLQLEKSGIMGRLDPTREFPKVFKGPTIDGHELEILRSVKDVVRLGRISSIEAGGLMKFAKKDESDSIKTAEIQLSSSCERTVFIDCMVEDLYGYTTMPKDLKIYDKNRVNLGPAFFIFNPSFSAALTAYLDVYIPDNDTKNKALFYDTSLEAAYDNFLADFYFQMRTIKTLIQIFPPVIGFVLNSRTNLDAITHHSFLQFIWMQIGPYQLMRKSKQVLKKMESGGFTDLKIDPEFIQRETPDKVKLTRAQKRQIAKRRKKQNKVKFLQSYPCSQQPKNKM